MAKTAKSLLGGIMALVLCIPLVVLPFALIFWAGNDDEDTPRDMRHHMSGLTINGQDINNLDLDELLRGELRPILINFLTNAETEELRELLQPLLVSLVQSDMVGDLSDTIKNALLDVLQSDEVEGFGEFLTDILLAFLIENDVANFGQIITDAMLEFLRSGQIEDAQRFIRQTLVNFLTNDAPNFADDVRSVILMILTSNELRGVGQIVNDFLNQYFTRAQIQGLMLQLITPEILNQLGLEQLLLDLVPVELRGTSLRNLLLENLPAEFRNQTLRSILEEFIPADFANMGFNDLINDINLDVMGMIRELFPDDLAEIVAVADGCENTLFAMLMTAVMGNLIDLDEELEPNMLPGVGLGQLLDIIFGTLDDDNIQNLQGEDRFREVMRPLMHLMLGMPEMFAMFTDHDFLRTEIAPVVQEQLVDMVGSGLGAVLNFIMGPGMVNQILGEIDRNIHQLVRDPGMFAAWTTSPEFAVWEAEYNAFIATPQFYTYNVRNRQGRAQFLNVLAQNTFLVQDGNMWSNPAMYEISTRFPNLVFDLTIPVIDLLAIEEALLFYPGTQTIRDNYNPWFRYFVWHNPTAAAGNNDSRHYNYLAYRNWLVNNGGVHNAAATAFLAVQERSHVVPTPNETHGVHRWNLNMGRIVNGTVGRDVMDMSLYTLPTLAVLQTRAVQEQIHQARLAEWVNYSAERQSNWVGSADYNNWRNFANNAARISNRANSETAATGASRNMGNAYRQWIAQAPNNLAGRAYRMQPAEDMVRVTWTGSNPSAANFRLLFLNNMTWVPAINFAEWEYAPEIDTVVPANHFEFTDMFYESDCGRSLWARGVPTLIDDGSLTITISILFIINITEHMTVFDMIYDMMIPMLLDELPLDGLTHADLIDLVDMVFSLHAQLTGPLMQLVDQMLGVQTISDAELITRLLDVMLPYVGDLFGIEFISGLVVDLLAGLLPEPFNNAELVGHLVDTQLDALLALLPTIIASTDMHATIMDDIFPLLVDLLSDEVLVDFVVEFGLGMLGLDESLVSSLMNVVDTNALLEIILDENVDCLVVALVDELLEILPDLLADELIQTMVPGLVTTILLPILPEDFAEFANPALVEALIQELLPILPDLINSEDLVGELVIELIDILPQLLANEVIFDFFYDMLFLDIETWLGDEELRIWFEGILDAAIANFEDDNWFETQFNNLLDTLINFLNDEMIDDAFDWLIATLIDAVESNSDAFNHYFAVVINQIIYWLDEDRVIETAWDFVLGHLVALIDDNFDMVFDALVNLLVMGIENDDIMDTLIGFVLPLIVDLLEDDDTFNMVFDLIAGELLADLDIADLLGDVMDIFAGININLNSNGTFEIGADFLVELLAEEDPMLGSIIGSLLSAIEFTIDDNNHIQLWVEEVEIDLGGAAPIRFRPGQEPVPFVFFIMSMLANNAIGSQIPLDIDLVFDIMDAIKIDIILVNVDTILFDMSLCVNAIIDVAIDMMEIDLGDFGGILNLINFGTLDIALTFERAA